MSEHTQKMTTHDHSVANLIIVSFLVLCGITVIFLLGLF